MNQLPPGTRFCVPDLGITGRLMMVNDCRARVRIDQPQRVVEFTGPNGQHRVFQAKRNTETSWAPTVVVEVLSFEPLTERDTTMTTKTKQTTTKKAPAKKTAKKATAAKPASKAKAKTPRAAKADGKLSQLDAAVKVLSESQEPMTSKQMIEAMSAKGYWTSPGGKTPHATLYSAILREIQSKGKEARFTKVDKGTYTLNADATPKATGKPAAKKTGGKPANGTPGPKAVSDLLKI